MLGEGGGRGGEREGITMRLLLLLNVKSGCANSSMCCKTLCAMICDAVPYNEVVNCKDSFTPYHVLKWLTARIRSHHTMY